MKTVKVKANGKLNLGLNVTGRDGEFHSLDTIMCSINLSDTVTVSTSKNKAVNLKTYGFDLSDAAISDNNVYKAARAFIEKFGTCGGAVTLKKVIPVGSGLGGSSADIVATVKAFAQAYGVDEDLLPLVNSLCSDGEFLLNGGIATVSGRGGVCERYELKEPLYFVLAIPEVKSITKEVFAQFDKGDYPGVGFDSKETISRLLRAETLENRELFNALYQPAKTLNPEIEEIYEAVRDLSPNFFGMSGSG